MSFQGKILTVYIPKWQVNGTLTSNKYACLHHVHWLICYIYRLMWRQRILTFSPNFILHSIMHLLLQLLSVRCIYIIIVKPSNLLICCYCCYRQMECILELIVKCTEQRWGGHIAVHLCCEWLPEMLSCCYLPIVTIVTCPCGTYIVHKHLFLHFSNLMYPWESFTLLYWCTKKGVLFHDGLLLMVIKVSLIFSAYF